jgi:hypothetical protein
MERGRKNERRMYMKRELNGDSESEALEKLPQL